MTGDRHVRFLGGGIAETRSRYPTEWCGDLGAGLLRSFPFARRVPTI